MAQSSALMIQPNTILPMDNEFEKMLRMAAEFAQSGILAKGIPAKPAAVLLVVQQGYELGIPPAAALANISIVEGKPTLDAKMHRALIYRDHGDDAFRFVETSAERCVIEYKRRGWKDPSRFTLTIHEIPEGLKRKDNWRNYPANMLRARATTFVSVMAFSDTTNGLYTPEEMGAEVEIGADGEPVMIAHALPMNDPQPIREIHSPAPPAARPERATIMNTPRTKAIAQPNGPDEQRRRFVEAGQVRGIDLTEDMSSDEMATMIDGALTRANFGFRVVRTGEGLVTARALHNALMALPPRDVDIETGEVREEADRTDEPEMSDDDRALYDAVDQGRLMPVDGGR